MVLIHSKSKQASNGNAAADDDDDDDRNVQILFFLFHHSARNSIQFNSITIALFVQIFDKNKLNFNTVEKILECAKSISSHLSPKRDREI